EQAPHAERDSIARVGGDALLPERLGHDTEHRAAVELEPTGLDGVNGPRAEPAGLVKWSRWRHAREATRRHARREPRTLVTRRPHEKRKCGNSGQGGRPLES